MNEELESLLQLASGRGIGYAEVYGNRLQQLESFQFGTALRLWQNARSGLAVASGKIDPELPRDRD